MQLLEIPYQLEPPINRLKRAEVQEVINSLNPKKSSSCDLITDKSLKQSPIIGIKYLTQFGFRQRHSTIEQTHSIIRRINEALENKQYCSASFLDIPQAFDKVWHTGLLYKLRWPLSL
jgi:hypothetical protein